jgi:hypothetical protein
MAVSNFASPLSRSEFALTERREPVGIRLPFRVRPARVQLANDTLTIKAEK